ncbi:hypothetical protein [Tautonia sociabilis]|uniref:YfhO family protein n=1 Tax=Tautonia sociabilis TaxID=2080755 RepID=A0A432MEI4_9BACT|nr:hypothetical protein [Tautonia sociabilis]RUL83902.1 hypothetical protein TsocGM_21490 [Tautonia sociabilis]
MSRSLPHRAGQVTRRAWRAARRRPRLVAALAVPAALGMTLLPDLFFAIPWPVRRTAGMLGLIGLIGLGGARLCRVRPGDRWPSPADGPGPVGPADRLLPWVLALATASLAWPLLQRPGIGYGDWDFYLQLYEAVRRTVLDYGQFPWWNPWTRGGFPLAGDPQCGLAAPAAPLSLLLGAGAGVRLAAVIWLMIAVEGARRLARLWLGDPWAACAAGLVFGLNGGVTVYTVAGIYVTMSFCVLPWFVYHATRLADGPGQGVALGLWGAFALLGGISYATVYAAIVAAAVGLRGVSAERGERRVRYVCHGVLAVGLTLLLSGWRLGTTLAVMGDFPRDVGMLIDLRPIAFFEQMLVRPSEARLRSVSVPIFWESNCYIGVVGVALLAASLARGWRWWHTLTIVAFALGLGASRWYHPSFWLSYWQVFRTMHAVTRWRIVGMLGVGLAAGSAVAGMRSARPRWLGVLASALVLAMGADLVCYAHRVLPVALGPPPPEDAPGPSDGQAIQLESMPAFPNTMLGFGTIRSIQPLLGYDTGAGTARLWRGHPDYVGEAWSEGRAVEPEVWTPNRVVFRVEPHQEIHINQNPGSWWLVNGDRVFAGLRCAEWGRPFVARADGAGRLELRIAPIGLGTGLALQAAGLAMLAGSLGMGRAVRWGMRAASGTDRSEAKGAETAGSAGVQGDERIG